MLKLSYRAEMMIWYAVHAQPNLEVGGFAKVEKTEGGLVLTDVLIPPQEVSGAALDLGRDGIEWMMKTLADRKESLSDWPCWWHSHSTMSPQHSTQDTETLAHYATMLRDKWAIGLVTNIDGEYDCWLTTAQEPWSITQNKVPVKKDTKPEDVPLQREVASMMKDVKKATYPYARTDRATTPPLSRNFFPQPLRTDSLNDRFDALVYCDDHNEWLGDCPSYHQLVRNPDCTHRPNCGGNGCFSKKDRKEMRRIWIDKHTRSTAPSSPPESTGKTLFIAGNYTFLDDGYVITPDGVRIDGEDDQDAGLDEVIIGLTDEQWGLFHLALQTRPDSLEDTFDLEGYDSDWAGIHHRLSGVFS